MKEVIPFMVEVATRGVATSNVTSHADVESSSLHTASMNKCNLFSLATTPINVFNLERELIHYDPSKASVILNGFKYGFPLYYSGPHTPTNSNNLKSARDQPEIIRKKNKD